MSLEKALQQLRALQISALEVPQLEHLFGIPDPSRSLSTTSLQNWGSRICDGVLRERGHGVFCRGVEQSFGIMVVYGDGGDGGDDAGGVRD